MICDVQEERTIRDRTLLEVRDSDHHIQWKVKFNLGNSSRQISQCRNSIQGKKLLTDELGYVCERNDLLVNGCCNVNAPGSSQYVCKSCLANGCCSVYEFCVSCCLQPDKQPLLERFLNRAAEGFQNLFTAVEDHFELCLAKCRTSSQILAASKGEVAYYNQPRSPLLTPPFRNAWRSYGTRHRTNIVGQRSDKMSSIDVAAVTT
ncbi:SREBP regulating gene protein [Paramisgurnus dabryanus]|uniref:SREBP regulating gene protein n=1 Tax=Paramisgurnus dabryanus TaxID=90735 RepID=UPI0031F414EC